MFHVPRCLAPSLSWLARACHFTSRVIYSLPCTLFCYVFDPLCTGYTLGDFDLLQLKLHRLRRLRLQCTTRVQLPVSVSVYGNRGPLCLSLTAFALRLLGRNAPTTFSRRSHRTPAASASTSLTSASSSLLLCCHRIDSPRVVAVILLYCVQRAHPGSERARVLSLAQQRRERVTRCSLALTGAL